MGASSLCPCSDRRDHQRRTAASRPRPTSPVRSLSSPRASSPRRSRAGSLPLVLAGLLTACDGGSDGGGLLGPDAGQPSEERVACQFIEPADEAEVGADLRLVVDCQAASGIRSLKLYQGRTVLAELDARAPSGYFEAEASVAGQAEGRLSFRAVATAQDGLQGAKSVSVMVDHTPPQLELVSPGLGSDERYVGTLALELEAWDPVPGGADNARRPVARLEVRLDRGPLLGSLLTPDAQGPIRLQLDIAAVLTGAHTLQIAALDGVGNPATVELPVRIVTAPRFRAVQVQELGLDARPALDLAVADEDGDGRLDLWFVHSSAVFVRHGRGDGSFLPPKRLLPESVGAALLLAQDLDGDGRPELVLAGRDGGRGLLAIARRNPSGSWSEQERHALVEPPTALAVASVDTVDGWPDLLVGGEQDASSLGVLRGRDPAAGTPAFDEEVRSGGVRRVRSIQVADVDTDGVPDVVVGRDDAVFSVFPGQGDGSFGMPRDTGEADGLCSAALGVVTADLLEDGVPDVAVTQLGGGLLVYQGTGRGDWQFTSGDLVGGSETSAGTSEILLAELDGDGHADLLVVNGNSRNLGVFLGRGDGTLHERESFDLGPAPGRARLGDFNGDSRPDLAYLHLGDDTFSVLISRGGGSFDGSPALRLPLPDSPRPLDLVLLRATAAARPDLAVITGSYGRGSQQLFDVLVARNDGAFPRLPLEASPFDISGQGPPQDARAGEVTGDERTDLVVLTSSSCSEASCSPSVNVLAGDGEGGFAGMQALPLAHRPKVLALCDAQGDGRLDVVSGLYPADRPTPPLVFGLVGGLDSVALTVDVGGLLSGEPADLQCARLNDDEAVDYISVNTADGALNYYKGSHDEPYLQGERQVLAVGQSPRRVIIADVDGDGQLDALASVANNLAIAFGAAGGETFDSSTFLSHPGREPHGVAVRDFTDDHLPDLAVVNQSDGTLSVYVNAGDRRFLGPVDFPTGIGPTELVSDDFNDDGCADLAALDLQGKTVTLLLAEGARCAGTP